MMVISLRVFLLFAALVGTHSLAENDVKVVEEASDIGEGEGKGKVDESQNEKGDAKVQEAGEEEEGDGDDEEDEEGEGNDEEEETEEEYRQHLAKKKKRKEERDVQTQEDREDTLMDEPLTDAQLRSMHAKMDKNADGKVSFLEITTYFNGNHKAFESKNMAAILEDFGATDTDKDGSLSLEEHLKHIKTTSEMTDDSNVWARYQEHETVKFRAADIDHDGVLSKTELPHLLFPEHYEGVLTASVDELMRQNDEDKDGKLNATEFVDLHGEMSKHQDGAEDQADFAKLDTDGDGFLNAVEMRDWETGQLDINVAMKKLFEVADKDKDGSLTADELAGAMTEIMGTAAHEFLLEHSDMTELYSEL